MCQPLYCWDRPYGPPQPASAVFLLPHTAHAEVSKLIAQLRASRERAIPRYAQFGEGGD